MADDHKQRWKQRWIGLHKRQAALGWAMRQYASGPGQEDEFNLLAAETEKVNAEINDLLREMMDDADYQDYRRELETELAKTRQRTDDELRALIVEEFFQMVKSKGE